MDSGLIKNHNVWIFWTWCLLKANHKKDYKQIVGFQEVILQPGSFIFGRKKAADETGLSEQSIRTCLSFLKKSKNLTIKSTNKFSVISITNWDTYQYTKGDSNQQSNQRLTSSQPAANHKQEHLNNKTKENTPLTPQGEKVSKETIFKNYLIEKIKDTSFVQYQDSLIEFLEYRMSMPGNGKYKTTRGIDGLLTSTGELIRAGLDPVECLTKTMEEEWLKPKPKYFTQGLKKGSKNGKAKNFTGNDIRESVIPERLPDYS